MEIIDAEYESENKKDFKVFDYRDKENILNNIENFVEKNPEIKIWAKKFTTLNTIKEYKNITKSILTPADKDIKKLIFFDYPATRKEFNDIVKHKNLEVLYLTKEDFSTSGEKYFQNIFKMLKFAQRKKGGNINIEKMSEILGIEEDFTKYLLDTLREREVIELIEDNSIQILEEEIPQKIIEEETQKETFEIFLKETTTHKNLMNTLDVETLLSI